ncbi:divalent-cation tolerance protein CutA [Mesobaculum littorinae]|uniref:Divalent-cation tolerance protein CutA n=1 Tax=Mesobaculum littorinae TaxID=2486419 RepID=A0A438AKH7_9RHOB|nr:divalent-cation tolerance protein CutA [Mesobaculum littorinae]RVV99169.1 divalent-cation tolerance protein CutA [Mesobaculum littorinae]
MSDPVELHVACPDADTGLLIARAAVEARLAACGNVLRGVTSVFRWEAAVEEDGEALLVLKTVSSRTAALTRLIRDQHPYDLPAITWHEIAADEATARWLCDETTDPELPQTGTDGQAEPATDVPR